MIWTFHNPHWPKSDAAPQQLHKKYWAFNSIYHRRELHAVHPFHRPSFMVQDRILTWLSMRCWINGTPRGRCPRAFHLLSPSPHPLRPHWHPSPPRPPHPLRLPLLQLRSSLRRWGKGCRQHQALHSSGWLRGRLLRYTASSTWLLSCCLILTAPWEWWFTRPFTNFYCCVAK